MLKHAPSPRLEVGVEHQVSGFWHLDSGNMGKSKVSLGRTCSVLLRTTAPIIVLYLNIYIIFYIILCYIMLYKL